jgi:hypothetical protein
MVRNLSPISRYELLRNSHILNGITFGSKMPKFTNIGHESWKLRDLGRDKVEESRRECASKMAIGCRNRAMVQLGIDWTELMIYVNSFKQEKKCVDDVTVWRIKINGI